MPRRNLRIRRGREVARVLRTGRRIAGRRLVMYMMPGGEVRAAFICGRRVGTAVHRNRARRVMREAWVALSHDVRSAADVVFVARPEIRGSRTGDVVLEMRTLLVTAGMIAG